MKLICKPVFYINLLLTLFAVNCFSFLNISILNVIIFALAALIINVFPSISISYKLPFKVRMCWHGTSCLRLFQISLIPSVFIQLVALFSVPLGQFLAGLVIGIIIEAVLFWNGIISLYLTSTQLGVRTRVLGVMCGMIPLVNLFVLNHMLRITTAEVLYEIKRELLDSSREEKKVCATKYPIIMVHGVFFRDFKYFNYWGRIPATLERNGATIYYGNHHSAASVESCAEELAERIKSIVNETGCEKLNVIAHSKGGLDTRYAMAYLGASKYIASLTTINTPHRGCKFADYLLNAAPEGLRNGVADTYNNAFKKFGDENPNFLEAVRDLTSSVCEPRDREMTKPEGVYCQSVGSRLAKAISGRFPLNLTYPLVNLFDGANDGLVGEESFCWGDKYTFVEPEGEIGISHADMIDLNRENLPDFDVREFYVELVSELKNKGL